MNQHNQPLVTVYNQQIDQYLNCSDADLGERSTFQQFISAMERGCVNVGGVPNDAIYSDHQVGWGKNCAHGNGSIAQARNLARVWNALPPKVQSVLYARYVFNPSQYFDPAAFSRLWHALDPKLATEVDAADRTQRRHLKEKDPPQPNTRPWQMGGLLVFLAWEASELAVVVEWFGESWNTGYPPQWEDRCLIANEWAHEQWQLAYRENTPELKAFKERLDKATSGPAFSEEFVKSVEVKL